MRLVAYLRVSTDRQAERGLGLDVQEQAVRAWAKAHGHRLVALCRDEGVSGSNGVEEREGLPEALSMLRGHEAEALIVARLDRLARALTVQEAILGKVWEYGAEVVTADTGLVLRDDPDDPMRTAMRQMAGVFAQLDRSLITKRLRDGRRLKAERGGFAYGAPPLGMRAVGGELVADADETATVERIRQLHSDGRSLREITAVLNTEGHATKRGGRWHPETLRRIVARL